MRVFVHRWLTRLSHAVSIVAGATLSGMTIILFWQVFARYVLNASPPWTESLALLLMLYFVLLAAATGVREGFHLRVRVAVDRMPPAVRGLLHRGADMLMAAFGVVMTVNGLKLAELMSGHAIPTLGITRASAYWPFVIGGTLIFVFSAERMFLETSGSERGRPSNS